MKSVEKMLSVLGACLLVLGCTKTPAPKNLSPDEVVKSFVELSASAKQPGDKQRLSDFCGGELKKAFDQMTEENFKMTYLGAQLKLFQFRILDSKEKNATAQIHYQVAVENQTGTDATREINEREVDLVQENGKWRIVAIRLKGSDRLAFTRGMIF